MIKLGRIYKRKPSNKASPYPAYLIPTGVNQLMTTALQTRYYYVKKVFRLYMGCSDMSIQPDEFAMWE